MSGSLIAPSSLWNKNMLVPALGTAIRRLDPRQQLRNPVMAVVWIGAAITSVITVQSPTLFNIQITVWLWFTLIFANFAEAVAEGRGKAQAESLRKLRTTTTARRLDDSGNESSVNAGELRRGDRVICEAGDLIPADGDVIEGIATLDESAITGESAPVIRESGGDRCAVTGGTRVISDRVIVSVTSEPGDSFLDRMISMVESSKRQATPNEKALNVLLISLTAVFLIVTLTLPAFVGFGLEQSGADASGNIPVPVLVALLVCLIPTTIGALVSAIGISGIDFLTEGQPVRRIRKGSIEAVTSWVTGQGGTFPAEAKSTSEDIAKKGGTPLAVAQGPQVLGVIELKDIVKGGIKERFAQLRRMGIRTIMVTGDNPRTAAAIAAEAGVDDFMAEAKPEDKLQRIRNEQAAGHLVAMTGDGTNDAPALAQADVGVAMNTGTQAAREAGNMVDLDSNPTKLIEVVEIGLPIPESDQPLIFERFKRGENSVIGGMGLGLPIAQKFAALLDGEVVLIKSDLKETRFEIRIPVP